MLSKDFIRETWEIETGVSEQGVEWDVIGFARAIKKAAEAAAIERCTLVADDCAGECPSLAGRVEARLIASKLRALLNTEGSNA